MGSAEGAIEGSCGVTDGRSTTGWTLTPQAKPPATGRGRSFGARARNLTKLKVAYFEGGWKKGCFRGEGFRPSRGGYR